MRHTEIPDELNRISGKIVDCALKVHRNLGPGLLEGVYEICLAVELGKAGFRAETQVLLPVTYEGVTLETGFGLDLLVENEVIVEVKAVDSLLPIHEAQLLTYLKLSGKRLGLLVNFNCSMIKHGIKRIVR